MRLGRLLTFSLVASVLLATRVGATKVELKAFTCPLDGTEFQGKVLVSTDELGGRDSDFCVWPKGSSPLPYQVQVCPECFFAALNDIFNAPLPEEVKADLKEALAKWRAARQDVKNVEDLSPAQRWELTAICRIVRGNHPPLVGKMWMRAAWAVRHAALRDLRVVLPDPLSAFEIVDRMERDLKKEKDPQKLIDATFQLVMATQRAGDVARRDRLVKTLEGMQLSEERKGQLEALKRAFAAEALYQQRAIDAFNEAVDKELVKPEEMHIYLYRIAEATRRVGKGAEAVALYRKVKASGKIRRDIERMCDFMINWLEGD